MNFIKDNREMAVVVLVIVGLFTMAASVGVGIRGSQAWVYSTLSFANSTHALIASFIK